MHSSYTPVFYRNGNGKFFRYLPERKNEICIRTHGKDYMNSILNEMLKNKNNNVNLNLFSASDQVTFICTQTYIVIQK